MDIAFGLVMMLPKICFNKIILGVNKIYEQKYLTQDYFINHKKQIHRNRGQTDGYQKGGKEGGWMKRWRGI